MSVIGLADLADCRIGRKVLNHPAQASLETDIHLPIVNPSIRESEGQTPMTPATTRMRMYATMGLKSICPNGGMMRLSGPMNHSVVTWDQRTHFENGEIGR